MGTLQPAIFQSGGQASSHYIPGAYSRIDFAKSAGGLSSINNAVIAGDSRGGEPNKLLTFTSLSEAKAALRSGPLLDAIQHAFNPGPDYVPQRISAWRVNPGLQASKSFAKVFAGIAEVQRVVVTHAASTQAGNISVVIDGAAPVSIAVLLNDTPAQIATKIAAGTYPGWTAAVGVATDEVLFTASAVGVHSGASAITDTGGTGATFGAFVKTKVGAAAATVNPIVASAWDWGLHTNQVKVKLEAGTVSGKKLTVGFQSETSYVADNIIRPEIQIQYSGSAAACLLTINSLGLRTFTDTRAQELSCDFGSFPTIQDLVNYINDQPGYAATVVGLVPTDLTTQLDWVASADIRTTAVTLYANTQALIDALKACPWVADAVYSVQGAGYAFPDDISAWAYFTGGTDGAYTSSEWAASLTLLEKEDIQFIGSSSEEASIHALIKAHCESMNSVTGKNERQFILGGASGETVDQFITRCQNLNSWSGSLVYPEFQDWDRTNSFVTWWSPAYYAAKLLGMVTCVAIPEPLTNKQVSVLGFKSVSTSDIEKIIRNGGVVGRKTPNGLFVTTRMITTYQGNELQKVEFSMVREALFINRDLRNAVEATFVGRAMTNGLLTDVDSTVSLKLVQYAALGLFNGTPMYWGYKRRVNGDQIIIEFNCYLTPPTNFLFITSHMAVYAQAAA